MARKPRKSRGRQKAATSRAKNGYRLPNGDYVSLGTSSVTKNGRTIGIRAVHRAEPDLESLARAFVEIAKQQSEVAVKDQLEDQAA